MSLFKKKVGKQAPTLPDGWTDDLSLSLPDGVTYEDIVTFVIETGTAFLKHHKEESKSGLIEVIEDGLMAKFGLTKEDAFFARDRTFGGISRATTKNVQNCPDAVKDPVAWTSFQKAWNNHDLLMTFYPERMGQP